MEASYIVLCVVGVLLVLLLVYVIHLLKVNGEQRKDQRDYELLNQRLLDLERDLGMAFKDMRNEQNMLARAARQDSLNTSDRLSELIDKRVARLADKTDQSLELIRNTVDERLNQSLENKFSQVSSNLAKVHTGIGQLQTLAGGIDELKRVMTNVKTRGIWGELQLAKLLQDMLPRTRYAENVEVKPSSGLRVEFALRLPGDAGQEVLLPIDAKLPQEDYQRLQQAREAGDAVTAEGALKQLERRLKAEAKDIATKYICPPYSTDFAVMYLPSEGLFTEALSIPGLTEELQSKYHVCVAGPTTFAALVNSLQLGFRTLAVQQRTTEVWQLLAQVKDELVNLSAALEKSEKKLEEAQAATLQANKKFNNIRKKLESVETLESLEKTEKLEG